jgi:hypothetical protein
LTKHYSWEVEYIFVVEDGVWKYDEVATMEKALGGIGEY